jgi:hypothetical protein
VQPTSRRPRQEFAQRRAEHVGAELMAERSSSELKSLIGLVPRLIIQKVQASHSFLLFAANVS